MNQANDAYLETEVLTATTQKLQLLLIEAAIRATHRGKQKAREGDQPAATEHFIRAQDCVGQILSGLNYDGNRQIVAKLAAIYVFVLRQLAEGAFERNEKKLDEAIRILEIERETWRQVCEKYGSQINSANSLDRISLNHDSAESSRLTNTTPPPIGRAPDLREISEPTPGGLCLDA